VRLRSCASGAFGSRRITLREDCVIDFNALLTRPPTEAERIELVQYVRSAQRRQRRFLKQCDGRLLHLRRRLAANGLGHFAVEFDQSSPWGFFTNAIAGLTLVSHGWGTAPSSTETGFA
jgi:hypothetical protein